MNQFSRNVALWLVLALMVLLVVNMFQGPQTRDEEMAYSEFVTELKAGKVEEVTVQGNVIRGTLADGKKFRTYGPQEDAIDRFLETEIPFNVKPEEGDPWYIVLLVQWFPMYATDPPALVTVPLPSWRRGSGSRRSAGRSGRASRAPAG